MRLIKRCWNATLRSAVDLWRGVPRATWCETDHVRGKTRDRGWPEATGLPVVVRRSALLVLTELGRKVETSPGRFWRLGGDFYDNN